jgi:hypothetical protein
MNSMIALLLVIIAVEAVTEILVASKIFFALRDKISQRGELWATFVNCGYCVSVWVSAAAVLVLPRLIIDHQVDYIFRIFIVHRLSNVLHELFSRWFGRMPWMLMLNSGQDVPPVLKRDANEQAEIAAAPEDSSQ